MADVTKLNSAVILSKRALIPVLYCGGKSPGIFPSILSVTWLNYSGRYGSTRVSKIDGCLGRVWNDMSGSAKEVQLIKQIYRYLPWSSSYRRGNLTLARGYLTSLWSYRENEKGRELIRLPSHTRPRDQYWSTREGQGSSWEIYHKVWACNRPQYSSIWLSSHNFTNHREILPSFLVENYIKRHASEELKPLHRICLDRPGSVRKKDYFRIE
jgi:hypothetical protein